MILLKGFLVVVVMKYVATREIRNDFTLRKSAMKTADNSDPPKHVSSSKNSSLFLYEIKLVLLVNKEPFVNGVHFNCADLHSF